MRKSAVTVVALLIAILGVWLMRSSRLADDRNKPLATEFPATSLATTVLPAVAPPSDSATNPRRLFAARVNTFIAAAKPFGIEQSIAPESIVSIQTNKLGTLVLVETDKHLAEFRGHRLMLFASTVDGTDTRRDPSGVNTWYQATAPWTQEQAVSETKRLMQALGISVPVMRVEYEATPITVKNPAGDLVRITPFHNVRVYTTNDSFAVKAEFRMGSSGPGRLTRWFDNTP
jgi:hypothetical protein